MGAKRSSITSASVSATVSSCCSDVVGERRRVAMGEVDSCGSGLRTSGLACRSADPAAAGLAIVCRPGCQVSRVRRYLARHLNWRSGGQQGVEQPRQPRQHVEGGHQDDEGDGEDADPPHHPAQQAPLGYCSLLLLHSCMASPTFFGVRKYFTCFGFAGPGELQASQ